MKLLPLAVPLLVFGGPAFAQLGTFQALGTLNSDQEAVTVRAVSGDGSVALFQVYNPNLFQFLPLRWTEADGLQALEHPGSPINAAYHLSDDGDFAAGVSQSFGLVVWDADG